MNVKFSFPSGLRISPECQDLITRIFIANPVQRITIHDIRRHAWFLRNLPAELAVRRVAGMMQAALRAGDVRTAWAMRASACTCTGTYLGR